MTNFTSVFTGSPIYPSDLSYLALTPIADVTLDWPLETAGTVTPAARVVDVTANVAACSIILPDATQASQGQSILFNSLSASTQSFTVKDNAGGAVATIASGEQWMLYLASNASTAGTWRVFRFGASTASVQASALAGYGLTVGSNQLSQSMSVVTFNSSPRTVLVTDRASLLVWTGAGTATLNLPVAATAANNFFFVARNSGGGDATIDPAGSETINGAATLNIHPGDSAIVVTDGAAWYTVGLGQDTTFAFDFTSISLASAAATYTLSGAELNRVAYKFTGALTNDVAVVVPPTVQQYWFENATSGSYNLTFKVSGGTAVTLAQSARDIYYCNGTNVVKATTGGISLPIAVTDGGTGQSSYTTGDLLYATGAAALGKLNDVATGNALLAGGVGVAPAWGKVGLTTHVSGTLPVANGGTGITALGTGVATALGVNIGSAGAPVVFNGAGGTPSSLTLTNATGLPLATGVTGTLGATNGGTGQTTVTTGDLIYGSAANTWSKLADVATGNALISGGVGVAPSWGKIGISTHVSGLGTGVATALAVNTGSAGAVVTFNGALGTPSSGTATNLTGLPLTTGVTGTLPVANGGTGVTTSTGTVNVVLSASPTLTGVPLAPTAAPGTNTTQLATCAFVTAAVTAAGGMVYPGAGIPNSTGSAWGTSYTTSGSGTVLALATSPVLTTPNIGTPSAGNLTNCTVDGTNAVGFLNIPQQSKSVNYTLVLGDAGKHVYHPSSDNVARTFTIPSNASVAYPIGTALTFVNMAATAANIAITTDTMYLAGTGTTGTRSLAQYGEATALKTGTTEWVISGAGLS